MKKNLVVLLLPITLFVALWGFNGRHLPSSASAEDLKIEKLLRQADRMEINVQVEGHETLYEVKVAYFLNGEFYPLTRSFRLGGVASSFTDAQIIGPLWFRFYKGNQELAAISNAYHEPNLRLIHCASSSKLKLPKRLHQATAKRFRQFVVSRPWLVKAIESAG